MRAFEETGSSYEDEPGNGRDDSPRRPVRPRERALRRRCALQLADGRHRPTRFPFLSGLEQPHDLAECSDEELADLAAEMREAIIDTVSQHRWAPRGEPRDGRADGRAPRGASSPRDRIVWDVGHQAYGHKLLTGRLDGFGTLRQYGGISGFLRRVESEHDVMGAGHASTSISYATGLAEGLRHSRREGRVVAVIGDGALTGGMAYEGLNQAGALGSPITVVLNDNGMSISENVGALSKLFQRVRVDPTLTRVREELERGLARLPGATELGGKIRDATKSLWFVPGRALRGARLRVPRSDRRARHRGRAPRPAHARSRWTAPSLVHVKTVKGRGYPPAEADGEAMHGATPFVIESGKAASKKSSGPPNYTEVFGHALVAEAERDPRVVGITAAMLKGTGMQHMMARFPERTYDVGIAEQHAVVFACGLAINGFRPVCAIYSTFLQRAFDPIVHDVAIQDLPVVFAIDRGGLVGDDGPTHHGAFDLAYLRSIPGLTIMAPMDEAELVDMLHTALRIDGPVALRYPRGAGLGAPIPRAAPSPSRSAAGWCSRRARASPWWATASAPSLARAAADLVAEGTRRAPDRGQRPLLQADRRHAHPPARRAARAAGHDRGPRRSWPASAARCSRCSRTHPVAGAPPRPPRPLRRPRQARAAARRRRAHARARRRADDPRAARALAHADRRGLRRTAGPSARPALSSARWPAPDSIRRSWRGGSSRRARAPRPPSWPGASRSTAGRSTSRAPAWRDDAELAVRAERRVRVARRPQARRRPRRPRRRRGGRLGARPRAPPRAASPTACCAAAPSGSSPSTWATGSSTGGCARIRASHVMERTNARYLSPGDLP